MAILLIRTILIYAMLILVMRLSGKRQIGELQLSELITTFLLSELASYPLTDPSVPFLHAAVPIITIVCLEIILSFLATKSAIMKKILDGKPSIIIRRDHSLSEDISYRFNDSSWSEYPLFADNYAQWIANLPEESQVINLFMELCALGIFQPLSSNILEFMKALPAQLKERGITFSTPSEICSKIKSVGTIDVPYPTSWVDEERDLSPWLGNVMQQEAINKLYSVAERVRISGDRRLKQDWDYLQASNNFRFISTKPNSYGAYRGIYDSPYDAFTNYMNIIGDFVTRVNNIYGGMENEELNSLLTTIKNQDEELAVKEKEIKKLKQVVAKLGGTEALEEPKAEAPATPAKKAAPKKCAPKKATAEKKEAPAKKAPTKKAATKK